MAFTKKWTKEAKTRYSELRDAAKTALDNREKQEKENKKKKNTKRIKASPVEGLFKQVDKALGYLGNNPKHPSLKTHEYSSLIHPWNTKEKVFEAYAQNNTPGAYRIFFCYGPSKGEITIIAITPHP